MLSNKPDLRRCIHAARREEILIKSTGQEILRVHRRNSNGSLSKAIQRDPTIAPSITMFDWLFEVFNEKFFESELSKPVIILSTESRRRTTYGWFVPKQIWLDGDEVRHYEINICPEHINRPIEEVCETLLHEMVHMKNAMSGVEDCHRNGLYHTKKFQTCAERHGLNAVKTEKYGWAKTSLKDETLDFIKSLNLEAFKLFRNLKFPSDDIKGSDEDSTETPKPSSSRKYVCPSCDVNVRATKEVLIRCEKCQELLTIEICKKTGNVPLSVSNI